MGVYPPQQRTIKDGSVVVLRSAEEGDAAAFRAFHTHTSGTSLYVATSPDEITDTPDERVAMLRQFRERPTELLLLAVASGMTPVGGVVSTASPSTVPGRAGATLPPELRATNPDGTTAFLVGGVGLRSPGKRKLNHVVDLGMSLAVGWRGCGLGRVILAAALEWATANPLIEKVTLGVIPQNQNALRLYESLGFEVEGVQKRQMRQPTGEYLDHIMMGKWLRP